MKFLFSHQSLLSSFFFPFAFSLHRASSASLDTPCRLLDPPLSAKWLPLTDQLDLQFQLNALLFFYRLHHQLDQRPDVFGSGRAVIDEEIAMQRADLRVADAGPFQARGFDQPAGVIAVRVLEH